MWNWRGEIIAGKDRTNIQLPGNERKKRIEPKNQTDDDETKPQKTSDFPKISSFSFGIQVSFHRFKVSKVSNVSRVSKAF